MSLVQFKQCSSFSDIVEELLSLGYKRYENGFSTYRCTFKSPTNNEHTSFIREDIPTQKNKFILRMYIEKNDLRSVSKLNCFDSIVEEEWSE